MLLDMQLGHDSRKNNRVVQILISNEGTPQIAMWANAHRQTQGTSQVYHRYTVGVSANT